MNLGQSYKENQVITELSDLYHLNQDGRLRYTFLRPSLTYSFTNAKLILDYDLMYSNYDKTILQNQSPYRTKDQSTHNGLAALYQHYLGKDQLDKLEFRLEYTDLDDQFNQYDSPLQSDNDYANYTFRIDYTQSLNLLDKTKLAIGGKYDRENINNNGNEIFDYHRNTFAFYGEWKSSINKIDFILGLRGENYDNDGALTNRKISYHQFKLFPNAAIKYNLMNSVYIGLNYNKKIKLPSTSALNPNNTSYESENIAYNGNPYLAPTTSDNFAIKLSAFDYATLSYEVSRVKNDIVLLGNKTNADIRYRYLNAPDLTVQVLSLGVPVPLMLFTKGFKELMKFNFDLEKMNILYFYVDYQKCHSDWIGPQKGIWSFFVSSQIILPKSINFQAIYKVTGKGNYRYLLIDKPFQNTLNFTLSKKFMKNDCLAVSLYGNDILNSNKTVVRNLPLSTGVFSQEKLDSRSFVISLNYKILMSKKAAKEVETSKEEIEHDDELIITKQSLIYKKNIIYLNHINFYKKNN